MVQENKHLHVSCEEDEIDLRELFLTIKKHFLKVLIFTAGVVLATLVYVLSIPNSYESSVTLAPQSQTKTSSLGGLSALAGMAGIDIGGGSDIGTYDYLNTILKDYRFNVTLIEKYNLVERIEGDSKNYIFTLGFRTLYDIFNSDTKEKAFEDKVFETYKKINTIITFSSDKKSGVMELSAVSPDRFLAKELVEIYLNEMTSYLRTLDMQDTDQKIAFYREEMIKKDDIELKKSLATLVSSLIQKSVLSKSSEYYLVKPITKPEVAHPKDKTKPKRALILIVSAVSAFIIAIFGVFFLEFLRNSREKI